MIYLVLINDRDIRYHHLGAGPQNLKFLETNIEILLIDICGNYEPISTTFSKMRLLSGGK